MTFVGKALVIVIMLFAVLFLGVSTVVFTTATNWKAATEAEKKKYNELQKKKTDSDTSVTGLKKDLDKAKSDHSTALKERDNQIETLKSDIDRMQRQITSVQGELTTAQQTANTALAEASANRTETDTLRGHKLNVEDQSNKFKLRQAELEDAIRILTRERDVAKRNADDLRDRLARTTTLLRQHGLSDDISQIKGLESPPAVSGQVARVDDQNKHIELTIGSDDGLVAGHELFLFRTKPRPEYLGKVKILSVDPDHAVAVVIGNTIQGKKIKEGDIVSSTIRGGPRS